MAASMVPAAFQHVDETREIGVDIGMRMVDRIAHASLCREMHHFCKTVPGKQAFHRCAIGEIDLLERETGLPAQDVQPRPLQRGIVIIVEVIEADHRAALGEQPARDVEADEPRNSGDQYWLIQLRILEIDQRLKSLSGPLYLRWQGRRNT